MSAKKLLVMAGGTGGHVFPALAVAKQLQNEGWQIRWLGTADRMEAQLVPAHDIDIDFIVVRGLRGKSIKSLFSSPLMLIRAFIQARRHIKNWQPDVVLGMGGYVSGPGGVAAWSCGVPIVIHEQNGVAGLTNRFLAKIAKKVMQAFPGAFPNAEVVGNPVRAEMLALPDPEARLNGREGPLRVLVTGGSQGARIINQEMPALALLMDDRIQLWHQVGSGAHEEVEKAYQKNGITPYKVSEFIDDMAQAYNWADVVIGRAGALTVSEVACAGLPAIFVPFPHKDRQQYWNALPLKKAGAAEILEQPGFCAQRLAELLRKWDRATLLTMAKQSKKTAITDATQRVAAGIYAAVNNTAGKEKASLA